MTQNQPVLTKKQSVMVILVAIVTLTLVGYGAVLVVSEAINYLDDAFTFLGSAVTAGAYH